VPRAGSLAPPCRLADLVAMSSADFHAPTWDAPFDAESAIAAIPETATLTGTFLAAVADEAKARGLPLPSARDRYLGFKPYPLREHARLLVEAARAFWPEASIRVGLRSLGRAAPATLVRSLSGRVVFGSAEGVHEALRAMAKSYSIHMKPGSMEIEALDARRAVARLRQIYTFLDPHHVGVLEGVMKFSGVKGTVKLRALGPTSADLLCEWETPESS
jgi:uncharacterized protein (TIGR02265 family)